ILSIVWVLAVGFIFTSNSGASPAENIEVDEFSSVGIALDARVFLEQGELHDLIIEASPEILEQIHVEVKDGKLLLKSKNNKSDLKGNITIRIKAPDYESVSISGSANLVAEKAMNLKAVSFKIAGSGTMDFTQLSAKEVEIKIAGSGKVVLAGKGASQMEVSVAGSGKVEAADFRVDEFKAKISGSGDCKVFAANNLQVSIAGSGSVSYKGEPKVNTSIAGSGKVKPI
ncbi:MAG: DUF2807 domain-containing protein, partial [Bacteroidales bacterium]|nr:DUF2807 domain-containing protein [Bacteroidales bacterium]